MALNLGRLPLASPRREEITCTLMLYSAGTGSLPAPGQCRAQQDNSDRDFLHSFLISSSGNPDIEPSPKLRVSRIEPN